MQRRLSVIIVAAAMVLGGGTGWAIASIDDHAHSPSATKKAPPKRTQVPMVAFGDWFGIKPETIYFSGDSGNVVSAISWSWGARSATGSGTWGYDNCTPNCAQGKVVNYPATVSLSRPVGKYFTHVVERQSGPHGKTYTYTLPYGGLGAG